MPNRKISVMTSSPQHPSGNGKESEPSSVIKKTPVRKNTGNHDEALPADERNSMRTYLQEIGQFSLLTPAQEVELANRIKKGDKAARDQMISANLRLVVKIAHDYNNFGLPLSDLISEGNIGLIKAVERFDPEKGGKLSTYAAWWIKQSIKRALANQGKAIRLPVHLVDKIAKMRKISAELAEELGRDPTDDELSQVLEIPVSKIAHYKSVSVRPTSLDAPVGDQDDTAFGEIIGDEQAVNPFESLREKSIFNDINQMIADELDDREEKIIRMRFGLDGDAPMTLEEVGEAFDITRERVRQLQNIALTKMRKKMMSNETQKTKDEIEKENAKRRKMQVLKEFFDKKKIHRES